MARILIAWELGAGWGHVARLRPIASELRRRGHQVVVALRDVAGTGKLFLDACIPCIAAPFKLGWPVNRIRPASSFAHILHNIGFASLDELDSLVSAWESLFDLVEPDVIVFDHSPTALLAARSRPASRIVLGDGFCCPPDGELLPVLTPWRPTDSSRVAADEQRTLCIANQLLRSRRGRPLEKLADLYQDVEAKILTTFSELDHFGARPGEDYHGPGVSAVGESVGGSDDKSCPRVVAYVRPFERLLDLVGVLEGNGISTLMYCPGVSRANLPVTRCVKFVDRPMNLRRAVESADFAVLNASHGTTAEMLLCGVPVLQIPLQMEQQLVAYRTAQLGAGLVAHPTRPETIVERVRQMLAEPCYRNAACRFSAKYRRFDAASAVLEMVDRIEASSSVAA